MSVRKGEAKTYQTSSTTRRILNVVIVSPELLQLLVLRPRRLQHGNIRVRILPDCEKILVRDFRLRRVALQGIGAPQSQMSHGIKHAGRSDATVVENLLILCRSPDSIVHMQKAFSTGVDDHEAADGTPVRTEFVRMGGIERRNRLRWLVSPQA